MTRHLTIRRDGRGLPTSGPLTDLDPLGEKLLDDFVRYFVDPVGVELPLPTTITLVFTEDDR